MFDHNEPPWKWPKSKIVIGLFRLVKIKAIYPINFQWKSLFPHALFALNYAYALFVQMDPGSKIKRSQLMFGTTFTKAPYQVLVAGETSCWLSQLISDSSYLTFTGFFLGWGALDLFLKVTSAVKLFFAIKWPLIISAILIIFYVFISRSLNFCVFVKSTNFNIYDFMNIVT